MLLLLILFGLLAGIALPVQIGLNNQLRFTLGSPALATLVSFIVGTVVIALFTLALRTSLPEWGGVRSAPWWVWTGGILGALYVFATIFLAPRLGAALLVSLTVAGQMAAALVLDHYGMLGFPLHSVSPLRVLGALLIVGGVVLVRAF
jgi:bacterial/archaeal transporter family-2 protein